MRARLLTALLLLVPAGAGAAEYIPIYGISLLGGQYFFSGNRSNLNGNVSAHAAPVVKFNDRWTFLPLYRGGFRGTKSVTDSVGSGTYFQQEMEHRAVLAALYTPPDSAWRLKPSANFKYNFLKETKDESWGDGLFDYRTMGAGLEAEYVYRDPFTMRFGYDYYYVRFPNYISLESQSGTDPSGNPLGRETAGTDVLDTHNHQWSFSASVPFPYHDPKVSMQVLCRFLWQTFPDQPLVNAAGQYNDHSPYRRQDFNSYLNLAVGWPKSLGRYRLSTGFQAGLVHNGSNQNTYDAGQTRFVFDSYSYWQVSAGPSFSLAWGDKKNPTALGLGVTYSHKQYAGRLAQTASGLYTSDTQWQDQYLVTLDYGYPIAENFRLTARTDVLRAVSNQDYEATYRYTYTTANYLFGFAYDY